MEIKHIGSQPSGKGPPDWFTGTVRIDPLFTAPAPARAAGARVTFEPGARTAWHTHPLGQRRIVTSGCGWVGREGDPVVVIRPGGIVGGWKHDFIATTFLYRATDGFDGSFSDLARRRGAARLAGMGLERENHAGSGE